MTGNQNLQKPEQEPIRFSKWWILLICVVGIYGFGLLLTLTFKAYSDKPPVPENIVNVFGETILTGDDIREGQEIFLRYGLMDNGTIWGHGAYLGPDFSALYLHRLAERTANQLSLELFETPYDQLNEAEAKAVDSQIGMILKENRYDDESETLTFTPYEEISFLSEPEMWLEYFSSPDNNGGLRKDLITHPDELFKLTAFFAWTAWAASANRPGTDYSYTNNFPYDELAGNVPTTGAFVWSAASLLFLLFGIGALLFVFGRNKQWGWAAADYRTPDYARTGDPSPSQKALVKFIAVVSLLFLGQTLVGGGVAHFRADPGNFYGFDLSALFPSDLLRTWHLQLAIFWIATGFVAGGLYLARVIGGIEFKGQRLLTNLLFAAFALVIVGSL